MANPADAKSALLSDELKEFALTLPTTGFPKNFFCTTCNELAFDSWKLLCCNKAICSTCHAKLEFPTACPSCDHSPLEADSCSVNKALRNTMRVWLQKQQKKEKAKTVPKPATPPADTVPGAAAEAEQAGDSADRPVESIESATKTGDAAGDQAATAGEDGGEPNQRAGSAATQTKENSLAPQNDDAQRRGSLQSQNASQSAEPTSATRDPSTAQNPMDGTAEGMFGNNAMMNMNGVPGQMGFGVTPNQGNFNGMGWNGMNTMNGMPNMMPNGNWNNMNPMDFNMNMTNMNGMPNMPNGMYGGFGGNMGMTGMNDMSAMNMMNYGGGYGNWGQGGNGAGYGNFNGYNQMGGYNQSGAQYPEMMNQFPKNNFQNQNRFHANGGAFPQQKSNRNGSFGGHGNQKNGPGHGFPLNANSRPGSRSGPQQNRDGGSPGRNAEAVADTKVDDEHTETSAEPAQEGKSSVEGGPESTTSPTAQAEGTSSADVSKNTDGLTRAAGDEANSAPQASGLNQIQTVESIETDPAPYDQSMMINAMHPDQAYAQRMMNDYSNQMPNMNGHFDPIMGYNQHNYGPRGGFNNAYGAATVLTGEPRGLGVEGAPTGPRAMREGRPNTGFSSRANNARINSHPPAATVPQTQEVAPASPPRRGRSRTPERDETLRTKNKSPTRSRSPSKSRARDEDRDDHQARSRSVEVEDKDKHRDRSATPTSDDDREHRKERRRHRSSRYGDRDERHTRDEEYDDRYRDDKDDRDDRARSISTDSKHRSRRDKEKHRSSRSYRDRSREHRRRHRSRSRSPVAEERYEDNDGYANGTDLHSGSSPRRRKEKHRERERERDRSRDKDRDRDRRDRRDRDYEHERDKDRSREKDKDKKRSRRDREADAEDDRDYDDEKHRSSRRSRKERDRDRARDRDYDNEPTSATSTRPISPPLNAPLGPSADGFSIRGVSRTKKEEKINAKPMAPPQPPTGPRAFQPPKGPAADRDKERRDSRDHRRKSSLGNSIPTTPTTPSAQDHYAAEREKNARERDRLDRDKVLQSVHHRATNGHSNSISNSLPTTNPPPSKSLHSKRSRDDVDRDDNATATKENEREVKVPTGPAAHRVKRRKSGDDNITSLFTAGLRKHAGANGKRRGGVKREGSVERELERTERERDGSRW